MFLAWTGLERGASESRADRSTPGSLISFTELPRSSVGTNTRHRHGVDSATPTEIPSCATCVSLAIFEFETRRRLLPCRKDKPQAFVISNRMASSPDTVRHVIRSLLRAVDRHITSRTQNKQWRVYVLGQCRADLGLTDQAEIKCRLQLAGDYTELVKNVASHRVSTNVLTCFADGLPILQQVQERPTRMYRSGQARTP